MKPSKAKKAKNMSSIESSVSSAKKSKRGMKRTPATRNSSRATAAQSPDLSAQVSELQAQIAALKALVEHPQASASPVSSFQSQPSASSPATDFPVSGLKSQVFSSIPIYELKETRPVGYQSQVLLDSSSEESQDGFVTGLLDHARIQWLMGHWDALCKLELEQIEHDPDRAKLALLAAAGRLQTGQDAEAKPYIRLAQEWGVNKKFIRQILISGVHNSIGRAAAIGKQQQRALGHFENAIPICSPGADTKLLTQARIGEQISQLSLARIREFETIKVVSINNYEKKVIVQSNNIIKNENLNHINLRIRQLDSEMAAIEAEKENLEKQKQSKYYDSEGYKEKKYWDERHEKFGFNIQGVGNKKLSEQENYHLYHQAGEIFISLCKERHINFSDLRVLDVGCGIGYYANLLKNNGVSQYLGVDISNVLFDALKSRFPEYEFRQCDITNCDIIEKYDLIIMIDVTQHIVNASKFSMAMKNIKRCLSDNGIFIVTSWLENGAKNSVYELSRDIIYYQREFNGWVFSDPKPFRDKYIFSVRRDKADIKT